MLNVRDLGRMPYAEAFALQKDLQRQVIEGRHAQPLPPMFLLLVEHDPPVITMTRRPGTAQHLLAGPEQLADAGVELSPTDRGGDITYHGPGQLVVYPILDLNALGLRLHGYMRLLEQAVIDTLARFGIEGRRDPAATGVWAGDPPAKICAMGVRISQWVSMHGLALNVTTDLSHFDLIVPCGLAGRGVTSMGRLLGDGCPPMAKVKGVLAETIAASLARPASAPSPG
jgi:lipoyl(octanoyl) transferase